MFAVAFKRRFGQELNYERLRFKSLGDLLESIPDIVRIENMRGGGYRVYGKGYQADNSGTYMLWFKFFLGLIFFQTSLIFIFLCFRL